jgi:predicted MFS family arabinose efflux permease
MGLLARPGDRHPKVTIVACMAGLTTVFAVLALLAAGQRITAVTVAVGVLAILGWGATATAVPPLLQTAAMRHSPEDPDGASGFYVAAFQVGIMAGSLAGGLLFEQAGEPAMLSVSALLIAGALVCVAAGRDLFAAAPVAGDK